MSSSVQALQNETDSSKADSTSLSIGVPAMIVVAMAAVALLLARCRRVDGLLLRHRSLCSPALSRFLTLDFVVHTVLVAGLVLTLVWYVDPGRLLAGGARGGAARGEHEGCVWGRAGVSCCRRRCGRRR
jgi:hypothetical protein